MVAQRIAFARELNDLLLKPGGLLIDRTALAGARFGAAEPRPELFDLRFQLGSLCRQLCLDSGFCVLGVGARGGDGRELGDQPLELSAELAPFRFQFAGAAAERVAFLREGGELLLELGDASIDLLACLLADLGGAGLRGAQAVLELHDL